MKDAFRFGIELDDSEVLWITNVRTSSPEDAMKEAMKWFRQHARVQQGFIRPTLVRETDDIRSLYIRDKRGRIIR